MEESEFESEPEEVRTDDVLVQDIEEEIVSLVHEFFPDSPVEVAMALQRLSISIQESIKAVIPDKDVQVMRSIARKDIERITRQMSESMQIMYQ